MDIDDLALLPLKKAQKNIESYLYRYLKSQNETMLKEEFDELVLDILSKVEERREKIEEERTNFLLGPIKDLANEIIEDVVMKDGMRLSEKQILIKIGNMIKKTKKATTLERINKIKNYKN